MSLSATQARLTRAAWVEYGGIPIFQIVDFPKRPIFITKRRCFGQTRSVISPRFLRTFGCCQFPIFRTNFDSFQKFTSNFLKLENLGTNLETRFWSARVLLVKHSTSSGEGVFIYLILQSKPQICYKLQHLCCYTIGSITDIVKKEPEFPCWKDATPYITRYFNTGKYELL